MGGWSYTPNALGEIVSQTNANGQIIAMAYDPLGRLTSKSEPAPGGGTIASTFTWGTSAAAKNIGQLQSQSIAGSGITTHTESYTFDSLGRRSQTSISESGTTYLIDQSYDATSGLIDTLTYPTSTGGYRHKVKQDYQNNKLKRAKECTNTGCTTFGTTYWTAVAENGFGHVTTEDLGNTLRTARAIDVVSGYVGAIQTGPGGGSTIQNLAYTFDKVGNLKQRQDLNQSLTENFSYDNMHRLTGSTLNSVANLAMTYAPNGNIATRQDSGGATLSYTYHPTKIHAVTGVNGGGTSLSYTYDSVGNVTAKNGAPVTWFAQNKPKSISNGTYTATFEYRADGGYWKQVANYANGNETTLYIGGVLEKVTTPTDTFWRHNIVAAGRTVAIYSRAQLGTNSTTYPLTDHLGSTESITNTAGTTLVKESFAAFGSRRGSNWAGAPSAADMTAIANVTRRGFTAHSMLDNLGLVHMNGRVYDPQIGRFLSADPFIQYPDFTQSWNRYSYVFNNPLSYIDPSGYFSLGRFFRRITNRLAHLLTRALPGLCGPAAWVCQFVAAAVVQTAVSYAERAIGGRGTITALATPQIGFGPSPSRSWQPSSPATCNWGTCSGAPTVGGTSGVAAAVLSLDGSDWGDPNDPLVQEAKRQANEGLYTSLAYLYGWLSRDLCAGGTTCIASNPPDVFGVRAVATGTTRNAVAAWRSFRLGPKVPLPRVKSSNFGPKVDDPIPANGVPQNWSVGQIEDAIVDYRTSITSRKLEAVAYDALGGGSETLRLAHWRRITDEERFLKSLEKALGR